MARRYVQSLRHRADQSGMLLAAANVPLTFQRTLMPRPDDGPGDRHRPLDRVEPRAGRRSCRRRSRPPRWSRSAQRTRARTTSAWSRASLALDVVAIGAGIGLQRAFRQRRARAAAAGRGAHRRLLAHDDGHRRRDHRRAAGGGRHVPAARSPTRCRSSCPAAGVLAAAARAPAPARGAPRRRPPARRRGGRAAQGARARRRGRGRRLDAGARRAPASPTAIARARPRVLPVSEEVAAPARPRGRAARRSAARTRFLIEHTFGGIEHKETSVEAAFDIPPPNPFVSGSVASHVDFDSLLEAGSSLRVDGHRRPRRSAR